MVVSHACLDFTPTGRLVTNPAITDPAVINPAVTDPAVINPALGSRLRQERDDQQDQVSEAFLRAGRQMIHSFGIRRLRMDDVAREAGYGRATLYRRFATRDDLVWAVVTREIQLTLTDISAQIGHIPDLRERMVEAFAVTLERIRGNPLLQRLLQIEPDLLLPHLTMRGDEWLGVGRRLIVGLLQEGRSRGELRHIDIDVTAELMARVAHSMLLTPDGVIDSHDPVALRDFARTFIADPLFTTH